MRIRALLGLFVVASSQMGGCPAGNVGEGRTFAVPTIRASLDSEGTETDAASALGDLPLSGSSGVAAVTATTSGSHRPSISSDGRHVAFVSFASNLVSGDGNGQEDVFLRDRATGRTERISVSTAGVGVGANGGGGSINPVVSDDGRYVVFESAATNLGIASGGYYHVYRRDRVLLQTVHVSNDGNPTAGDCDGIGMTPDGRFVAYRRRDAGAPIIGWIYVRDMQSPSPATVAVASSMPTVTVGQYPNPVLTADGRYLIFQNGVIARKDRDDGAGTDPATATTLSLVSLQH